MLGHLPLCANHRQFVLRIITTSLNTWVIMQTEVNLSAFCYIATYKIILSKSINLCLDRHRSAWLVWSLQPYCCFPFIYRQHHTHTDSILTHVHVRTGRSFFRSTWTLQKSCSFIMFPPSLDTSQLLYLDWLFWHVWFVVGASNDECRLMWSGQCVLR